MASTEFAFPNVRPRLQQLSHVVSTELTSPSLSVEALLDAFLALYIDCKTASHPPEHLTSFLRKYEKAFTRLQALRINLADFDIVKTLATGAVGKVCLVRYKGDNKAYAMKILKKVDLLTRQEAGFFMEERDALVFAKGSEWITTLYAAFQDEENLYLVMEYASGGSLRSLLDNREEPMSEDEARFYIAQILVSLEELHSYNFIHRDVKPENCLIDASGHLKLADFGSCIKMDETEQVTSHQTVGTPDYISPEILRAHEGKSTYGRECDWWSLGIIMFELLYDEVPFYSESLMETYGKIMDHERHFAFPEEGDELSEEAIDLMKKLICKREMRLGRNGAEELKQHRWFRGIDWVAIRTMTPPFIPELNGPDDTRYFENEEDESKKFAKKAITKTKEFAGQNLPFIGYTYVQNAIPTTSWDVHAQTGYEVSRSSTNRRVSSYSRVEADATRQRIEDLSLARQAAEDDMKKIRMQLSTSLSRQAELENELSVSEKKRHTVEAALAQTQSSRDTDARERDSLQRALSQLKRSLDKDVSERSALEELKDSKLRLERELDNMRTQLKHTLDENRRHADLEADLANQRNMLLSQIDDLKVEGEEQKHKNETAIMRAAAAAHDLEILNKEFGDLQLLLIEVRREKDNLHHEVELLKSTEGSHAEELERLAEANARLERARTEATAELNRAILEKRSLEKALAEARDHQRERVSDRGEEITGLQAQLEEAIDQMNDVSKRLASSTAELTESKQRMKVEIEAHSITKEKLRMTQTQLQEEQRRLIALQQSSEIEIRRLGASLKTENDAKASAERRAQSFEVQIAGLSKDLETTRDELRKQIRAAQQAATLERLYSEAQLSAEKLRGELHILSETVRTSEDQYQHLKEDYDRSTRDLAGTTKDLNALRVHLDNVDIEAKALRQLLKDGDERRFRLEHENDDLRRALKAAEAKSTIEGGEIAELRKINEEQGRTIEDLGSQCVLLQSKVATLVDKVHDLEAAIHLATDGADETSSRFSDGTRADNKSIKSTEKLSTRPRASWKSMLFRSNHQPTKSSQPRPVSHQSFTADTDDDSRKTIESLISRRSSSLSLRSAQTKPDILAVVNFSPVEGLRGWLKVPKGGKVKKGWKQRYAVVRDYKLYMYDRDKDVGSAEGSLVADLRYDIFVVKGVSQNELIHANAKDIDCIFKIQVANGDGNQSSNSRPSSLMLNDSHNETNDAASIQRKITKLDGEITLEEKMLHAAEKMWSLSSEANRATLNSQIDAAQNRLRGLRVEQDRYKALLQASDEPRTSFALIDQSHESLDEDICFFRKRLDAQLAEELRKRDALVKVATATPKPADNRTPRTGKGLTISTTDQELNIVDRNIAKIKEDLVALSSDDHEQVIAVIRSLTDATDRSSDHGHTFKLRQYYKPTDCAICHDPLWGSKNQGLECTGCKMICHRSCRALVDVSCRDTQILRTVQPLYFMAQDPSDRSRWIVGLEHFKKELIEANDSSRHRSGFLSSVAIPESPLEFSTSGGFDIALSK
ncbi:hypothetical protein BC832DRAFT_560539 [Gaertneriomyces semiglobifer]|nr:hypothetical protein BC832DRAFT_560539 [Gaertneriomyces semiglobifer]